MIKHFIAFGTIILFLLLALASTSEHIEDATDTSRERDCDPLSSPANKTITCFISVTDKISGDPVSSAYIEIWVKFLKFKKDFGTGCTGFLEVEYFNNEIDFFTDDTGSIIYVTESFYFEDYSDVIEIMVRCTSPEEYDFQAQTKGAIFSWTGVELAEFNFSLLSNEDL